MRPIKNPPPDGPRNRTSPDLKSLDERRRLTKEEYERRKIDVEFQRQTAYIDMLVHSTF
jgi:hypothetical protein